MSQSRGPTGGAGPVVVRLPGSVLGPVTRGVVALVVALLLFGSAMALSRGVAWLFAAVFEVGPPGTTSRLLVSTTALQVLGFGVPSAAFLAAHRQRPRSYLRLTECTQWTLFYGSAVGLALMLVAVAATVLFSLLGIAPAESAVGRARSPAFYLLLFAVSTLVAVPMEELLFRGLIQRRLTDGIGPAVGIAVASLLFASIHSTVSVGAGGEVLTFGMFVGFGLVLGAAYRYTENLFVPIVGHVIFNGVQILLRAIEVAF
ncbi:CPBP family intramembrane metalloprotease [Halovenus sp. WSH3]|uniref:CPBP family intramembrane metalloprotease n=1 Tax=Halovenus carboxidivorans TaxID=2692199 RepID=A0A6B0T778_9EURY|nr:CPBP family intramembrane glutamic endopeptidase [Halovenus carboxidivorans]MXR51051.1 CPBP family intramembrane metalloprotease [Halovenus carboxidivorans]